MLQKNADVDKNTNNRINDFRFWYLETLIIFKYNITVDDANNKIITENNISYISYVASLYGYRS